MPTLLLRLSAPMQSWGTGSKFTTRLTDHYPSKSGVIGLVAAALGYSREVEKEKIAELSRLKFGVRVDDAGKLITDFQTTEMIKKYEFGKPYAELPRYENRNISHRQYLSDASFLAGFEGDIETLEKIQDALNFPTFALFLGRKSCQPTYPINLGIRETGLYDSLLNEPWVASTWKQEELLKKARRKCSDIRLNIIMDADSNEDASGMMVRDVPVSFSNTKRVYRYRYVTHMPDKVIKVDIPKNDMASDSHFDTEQDVFAEFDGEDTDHDAFMELG